MNILNKNGIKLERLFTKPGVDAYDQFQWVKRDVELKNWRDGSVSFSASNVESPAHWSDNAVNIVASKYFRKLGETSKPENSVRELIERVVSVYTEEGIKNKIFYSDEDASIYKEELKHALVSQKFSFNSPVWFNVGTKSPWQVSACYILAVEDSIDSILNWYKEEGLIFKGGSGAGINLSNLRSSKERLKNGGFSSGPVSFMRGADASAGTIKSGGTTRRAAKMVILDINHPDIVDFIECKAKEEGKIRALKAAGYDMDLGGEDMVSVQYQNANNSVRIYEDFFKAVKEDKKYNLLGRDGQVIDSIRAKELLHKIAEAAWSSADPGVQYDSEIQRMHTLPKNGRITASNPCSEFLHLDNSSCNLSSINLVKFMNLEKKIFSTTEYCYILNLMMISGEISVAFGHFPTKKIGEVTKASRPIGIGFTNLGSLLMNLGLPYDSEDGREMASALTSLMSAQAYLTSTKLAKAVGTFKYYEANKNEFKNVISSHIASDETLNSGVKNKIAKSIADVSKETWREVKKNGDEYGFRNSQATLLAPTGTISFFMDSTTTGVEPDFALVKYKKMVDGTMAKFINSEVSQGLKSLGYSNEDIDFIINYLNENSTLVGCSRLKSSDLPVFATAVGDNYIAPRGHILMMAAIQPFISGAISKTVNLPESTSVAEIEELILLGNDLGLKAIAFYRDNCKVGQPLSTTLESKKEEIVSPHPARKRLPRQRESLTTSFSVGGSEGYMIAGEYEDGSLGELFLKFSKQGSTLAGILDAFSIAISIGLQHGVPLESYVEKFINMRFEPSGMTNDSEVRMATSLLDYIFKRLALDFLSEDERVSLGILTNKERELELNSEHSQFTISSAEEVETKDATVGMKKNNSIKSDSSPLCFSCGISMQRAGSCYLCSQCGSTSGCS